MIVGMGWGLNNINITTNLKQNEKLFFSFKNSLTGSVASKLFDAVPKFWTGDGFRSKWDKGQVFNQVRSYLSSIEYYILDGCTPDLRCC